ncbi:MAG: hypothetical protein ACUZ8H_02105 [Candidatus Anammoxibacter sp.]
MTVRGTIIYQGKTPKGMLKAFTAMLQAENSLNIQLWHDKFLKKHFFANASQKYKYVDRSVKYNKRKLKKKGHTRPFVFSGTLKRKMNQFISIKGRRNGATGKMKKPIGLDRNGRPFSYPKPEFDDELVAVTQSEVDFLAKEMHKRMTIKLNKVKENRKITV